MRLDRSRVRRILGAMIVSLPMAALGQNAPRITAVPRDALELAGGQIQNADLSAPRSAVLALLGRARNSYALRNFSRPWDLKVQFTVNSLGQTDYDGNWEMEDVFAPGRGLHWTASSSSGYSVAGIFGTNETFAETKSSSIPLRLQEARSMLYNPLPSVPYADKGSIRTVAATFQGTPVVCVLLARSRNASFPAAARSWDESEDCIDSQSGLLRMHSEVPGRYAVFDYQSPARLGSHILPRTITVTEGGRVVSTISVISLQAVPSVDPGLFVPTDGMVAHGPAIVMTAATKISRMQADGPLAAAAMLRPVCILGIVNPAGRLMEAHSLQPADPNSEAAMKDAQLIDFSPSVRAGLPPQQHFVFVIEKFPVAQ